MTVRGFDGIDDQIQFSSGAAASMTYGTGAYIFRRTGGQAHRALCYLHNSGGTWQGSVLQCYDQTNMALVWHDPTTDSQGQATTADVWYLALVRKATGTATPRFSLYNYTSTTWSHVAGDTAVADVGAPGASGTFRNAYQNSSDWFLGQVAVGALWANALPYSADTTGDAALEAAGLEASLQAWVDATPSTLWAFNQASVATPVEDLSAAGTADQSAITGTTVVTGDDPPGFSFDLGGGPPVLEEGPQQVIHRSNLRLG